MAIRGSNAVDLVHDLLRNRKTPDPVGWQQFANQMRAANIPMELVGNVTRRLYLQKKRGKRIRRNVPRRRNGRLYKFPIRSVRPSVVVLSSLSWSGGDRNYTDTTTILNASEVTVALPLYGSSARRTGRRKMAVDAGRVHSSQTGEAPLQTPLRRGGRS